MYKIIGADGNEYGPVSEERLRQWLAEGRLNAQSRVQSEGSSEWKTLGEVLQIAAPVSVTPPLVGQPTAAPVTDRNQLTEFPVAVLVLLHFFTCGIFSLVWLNLMHGKMPRVRADDPSAGKAIGFCFIPFYNLYWIFFTYRRLCLRVAEQRSLYGLPPNDLRGMATTACIFHVIPYVNVFIGITIVSPIFIGMLQASVNDLVRTSATTAPRGTLPSSTTPAPGMNAWAVVGLVFGCTIPLIGILAALLLPALASAREKARQSICRSNLIQIELGMILYADQYNGRLPIANQWCDALKPFLKSNEKIFHCPSAKEDRCSYDFNANMSAGAWGGDPDVVLVVCAPGDCNASVTGPDRLPKSTHRRGYEVLFGDGHVEFVPVDRLSMLHWKPKPPERKSGVL